MITKVKILIKQILQNIKQIIINFFTTCKTTIKLILQAYKKDYRHYICLALTLSFLALAIFYFRYAGGRIIESLNDIKTSAIYYVSELFELGLSSEITINNFTKMPFEMPFNLPNTWEEFKVAWKTYWVTSMIPY